MILSALPLSRLSRRPILRLEAGSLLSIVVITGLYARPLVEEWGFIAAFNAKGLGVYPSLARGYPLRPLQGVPSGLQWLLSAGHPAGMAIGFAFLLVLKYLAARWAVRPILSGASAWVVAVLATVLVPWAGQWHLRYSAAQLSAVFLFCALGAVLRVRSRVRWTWLLLGAVAIYLMLATYQALAVCCLLLPAVAALSEQFQADRPTDARWRPAIRSASPIALGFALYGGYAAVIRRVLGSGYEGVLVGDSPTSLLSIDHLRVVLRSVYNTAYVNSPMTLPLFGAILCCFLPSSRSRRHQVHCLRRDVLVLAGAVLLLPLLAAPYMINLSFVADPERVGFPVSVGFVLLVLTTAARYGDRGSDMRTGVATGLTAALIAATGLAGAAAYRDYVIQRDVLVQTGALVTQSGATDVEIRDGTGALGDVYTFYSSILSVALGTRGIDVQATICTPLGVDRHHPVAVRLFIPSTPRCEDLPAPEGRDSVLDAQWQDGKVIIRPAR